MVPENIVTVATCNFHPKWGDKEGNFVRIKERITEACDAGAQIILFPETALTGYNVDGDSIDMQSANAEPVPGPISQELEAMARRLNVYVVIGLPERNAASGALYNSALAVGPNGLIGCYRKIHPALDESRWAKKGHEPFLFDTQWGPVAIGICYDTYFFPELFRAYAALGARLYLNLTACSVMPGWQDFYYNQLKARVFENACFVASANLVGEDHGMSFGGGSLILGPGQGPINPTFYAEPVEDKEALLLATLDLSRVDAVRPIVPLYTDNPLTGTPDWRPDICEALLTRVRQHPVWSRAEPR